MKLYNYIYLQASEPCWCIEDDDEPTMLSEYLKVYILI